MFDARMMICMCPDQATHARRAVAQETHNRVANEKWHKQQIAKLEAEIQAMSVKAEQYDIMDVARVGKHLVMKVRYPSCTKCEFDGIKVMVFLDVGEMEAMRWRRIDPHFRKPEKTQHRIQAPSPAARFPGTDEGWTDALAYANGKSA